MKIQKSDTFSKKFEHRYTNDNDYGKVRDYCHYTGKYRDTANDICNLKCRTFEEILIVFHNGSSNDY